MISVQTGDVFTMWCRRLQGPWVTRADALQIIERSIFSKGIKKKSSAARYLGTKGKEGFPSDYRRHSTSFTTSRHCNVYTYCRPRGIWYGLSLATLSRLLPQYCAWSSHWCREGRHIWGYFALGADYGTMGAVRCRGEISTWRRIGRTPLWIERGRPRCELQHEWLIDERLRVRCIRICHGCRAW